VNARDLYNANRQFYAEDWGLDLKPWDDLDFEQRAAWAACAMEYTLKALKDDEEDEEYENGN
jgi:hypothetical protein